jgi:hypothetical protein
MKYLISAIMLIVANPIFANNQYIFEDALTNETQTSLLDSSLVVNRNYNNFKQVLII